jgi:hypothetical protein
MSDKQRIPRLTRKGQAHPALSLAAALAGEGTGAFSAPAHPFDEATGSGIKWTPEALELWLRGERLDVAEVATESPAACWGDLAFVAAFPTVTHWWFGSLWTQRVRATATARQPDGSRIVFLQGIQEDADELPWIVQADGTAGGPLPEYAGGLINLPLRLRLGQLARLVLAGQIAAGQWAAVTSLVAAHELPVLLAGEQRDVLLRALALEESR